MDDSAIFVFGCFVYGLAIAATLVLLTGTSRNPRP